MPSTSEAVGSSGTHGSSASSAHSVGSSAGAASSGLGASSSASAFPVYAQKYRFSQPLLFQRAHTKSIPFVYTNRSGQQVSVPSVTFNLDGSSASPFTAGATRDMLCAISKWPWEHPLDGDWVDATGVAQGAVPFASTALLPNATPAGELQVDVTSALQFINSVPQWAALALRSTGAGTLSLVGVLNQTAPVQSTVEISYADGGSETLQLWFTASLRGSTSYTNALDDEVPISASATGMLEFFRPQNQARPVQSATLRLQHMGVAGGSIQVGVFVVSPSLPDMAHPQTGLAAAHTLDEGLAQESPVIVNQLVTDQTDVSDVLDVERSGSYSNPYVPGGQPYLGNRTEAGFDPSLWGTPGQGHLADVPTPTPEQLDQLQPRLSFGKWIGQTWPEYFRLVHSNDVDALARGFTPLAPGLGAIELSMPGRDIPHGAAWFDSGEEGTDVDLWFDRARLGQVSEVFVRYYVLLGQGWEPNNNDFRIHFTASYVNAGKFPDEFGADPASLPWRATDFTGKFFGGAQQQTSGTAVLHYAYPTRQQPDGTPDDTTEVRVTGGGYGVSSGASGYQGRMLFQQGLWREDLPGPAVGGATLGVELYDFGDFTHSIPSQRHITGWDSSWQSSAARYGGLGHLYPGRWYCVELHWKLNTLQPYEQPPRGTDYRESGFAVDGFLEFYVDGVLAGRTPTFATRRLPVLDWALQATAGEPFDATVGSPARMRAVTNVANSADYMGFASVAGNLYYGGRSPNPRTKRVYINGVVASTQYVGPMSGVTRENGGLD